MSIPLVKMILNGKRKSLNNISVGDTISYCIFSYSELKYAEVIEIRVKYPNFPIRIRFKSDYDGEYRTGALSLSQIVAVV